MCLAVPMQITRIDGFDARCSARGAERDISLFMLQGEPLAAGDFVLVHAGYAIQKIGAEQARQSWELFDEILAAEAADA